MLLDEAKLRWLGMDMRPRWRRRVAVVVSYAAFLAAVSWDGSNAERMMMSVMFLLPMVAGGVLKDVGNGMKVTAWAVFVALVGLQLHEVVSRWNRPVSAGAMPACVVDCYTFFLLATLSAVGWGRLVDSSFPRAWRAEVIRTGKAPGALKQRLLAFHGFAIGVEGFARYEYGKWFRQLTAEERAEVEALSAANPRGRWMREPVRALMFDDERIREEEARVGRQVMRILRWTMVLAAAAVSLWMSDVGAVPAQVVRVGLWTLAAMAVTLRQAIPLWTEEDPRGMAGELGVVEVGSAV